MLYFNNLYIFFLGLSHNFTFSILFLVLLSFVSNSCIVEIIKDMQEKHLKLISRVKQHYSYIANHNVCVNEKTPGSAVLTASYLLIKLSGF